MQNNIPETSAQNSETQKEQWETPKMTSLDVEATQGGGVSDTEVDTSKFTS